MTTITTTTTTTTIGRRKEQNPIKRADAEKTLMANGSVKTDVEQAGTIQNM